MTTWDGKERRQMKHDCDQEDRLQRIEQVSDGTVKALAQLNITLIEIKTSLEGKVEKYDKHVDEGEEWRKTINSGILSSATSAFRGLMVACIVGASTAFAFGVWVATLQAKLDRVVSDEKVDAQVISDHINRDNVLFKKILGN